ncbi:MAG: hypothetical protein ACTSRC_21775, partial [Candidatus Helarchaeota archaeon]
MHHLSIPVCWDWLLKRLPSPCLGLAGQLLQASPGENRVGHLLQHVPPRPLVAVPGLEEQPVPPP